MWSAFRLGNGVATQRDAAPDGAKAQTRGAGPPRLLYIANVAWFFRSHRLPLAVEAVRRGYDVHLATCFDDQSEREEFERLRVTTHQIPFQRSSTHLGVEAGTVLRLRRLFAEVNPSLCHNVSIKPVIYGGVLSRLYGVPTINAISGMGYSYIARGTAAHLRRGVLNLAYSLAIKARNSHIIVQNPDDLGFFEQHIGVNRQQITLIRGSGVDLHDFPPGLPLAIPPLVVLPARMLSDKGVLEFVAAARRLKRSGLACRCALVGPLDLQNRAALSQQDMHELTADGAVEWWGYRTDMAKVLGAAQVVCLPSYREGLPKVLIEAAAVGRPIVATDVPGCREVVKHAENGLLVPPRDADALFEALQTLISNPRVCNEMGTRGRALVRSFSLDVVVARTMELYEEVLGAAQGRRRAVAEHVT